ncbi:hypothetical protein [Methylacidiphilum kamchatkense]|uniref:Uncharacterized protein n=1 Tax=Methylacidiphilum kamchatkense Kam1 TaxID=1202785 RepID=A0A516TJR6_9BACT|nr:hypothetical protein [Methylacidiphilum kamchatkense]QDQ41499.1 hypothetical protein kam1_244 [Methylacidiphilum kamchatkense Kam1]
MEKKLCDEYTSQKAPLGVLSVLPDEAGYYYQAKQRKLNAQTGQKLPRTQTAPVSTRPV